MITRVLFKIDKVTVDTSLFALIQTSYGMQLSFSSVRNDISMGLYFNPYQEASILCP